MTNIKLLFYLICCLSLSNYSLSAQSGTVTSGQEASGSGGSLSASLGQVVYQTYTSSGGTLSEGLQQAYEIFIITNTTEIEFDLDVQVYPNPTTDKITLEITEQGLSDLKYRLLDVQGKILMTQDLQSPRTEINFLEKAAGIYFVQLISDSQLLKTFKIFKNQ